MTATARCVLLGLIASGLLFWCLGCGRHPQASRQPGYPEGISSTEQTQSGLSCELLLPRKRFSAADDIAFYVLLTNVGTEAVVLDGRMVPGPHFGLELTAPKGETITWPTDGIVDLLPPRREDYITIRPGFAYGRMAMLQAYKELSAKHSLGKYSAVARCGAWEAGTNLGLHAWTGSLRSNQVQFEIVYEPW